MSAFAAGNADSDAQPAPTYARHFWLGLTAISLCALGLRLFQLDAESLWMDELVTVETYYHSSVQLVRKAADVGQPPLDNFLGAALVRLGLGDSDWWMRFPSAVFGSAGVLLLGVLTRRLAGVAPGLLAALLLAACPLHLYMSQEARPYTLFFFLALATILAYLRAYRLNTTPAWCLFAIALLAVLMTRWVDPHFLTAGLLTHAVGAWWLRRGDPPQQRTRLWAPLSAVFFAYAVYGPFFGIILDRSRGSVAAQGPDGLQRIADQLYQSYASLFAGYSTRTLFVSLPPNGLVLGVAAMLTFIGLAVIFARPAGASAVDSHSEPGCPQPGSSQPARAVFLTTVLPFPFLYALTFTLLGNAIPKPQYLLFGAVLVFPAVAIAAVFLGTVMHKRHGALGMVLPVLLCLLLAARMAHASGESLARTDKQDWRGLMNYLREHATPDDAFAVIAADTVPPTFHVAAYGRARYGPPDAKFMNLTLRTELAVLEQPAWQRETNTVWIIAYTDRMYRGHSELTPPRAPHPHMKVHSFEGLFLLESREAGAAVARLDDALGAVYDELPKRRGLTAPAVLLGKHALRAGNVDAARTWFQHARAQCGSLTEETLLYDEWIRPAALAAGLDAQALAALR